MLKELFKDLKKRLEFSYENGKVTIGLKPKENVEKKKIEEKPAIQEEVKESDGNN